jgi:ligand-binding sensor domain-containing protein/signal transduction histidine kinase
MNESERRGQPRWPAVSRVVAWLDRMLPGRDKLWPRAATPKAAWQRKLVTGGGLLLLPHFLLALDPARSIFQYNCQTWTRQEGLPARGINAIAQTKDGHLWLGTVAGPIRFDGVSFNLPKPSTTFQFRSAEVRSLSAARQGGLWVGTAQAAFASLNAEGDWTWGKEEWGEIGQTVNSVLETSDGHVWIATQSGAGRLSSAQTYESILPPAGSANFFEVNTTYEGRQGRIWLGTSRHGLYFWQGGVLTKFPDPALDEMIIRAVVEDQAGVIWVGSENGPIRYDAEFHRLPGPATSTETAVFLVDRHGAVWIGTNGGGLFRYLDGGITQMRKVDGLADDFVTALAEDHEGSLWIGTRNGLSQLSDVKMPTFGKTEGLTSDVNIAVRASRQGGLWVATNEGFTYFDGGTGIKRYGAEVGLGNAYIVALFEAKNGDVYLGNGAMEILVFSGEKIVARFPNQTWPTAFAEDATGVVAAVDGKLWRVGPDALTPYLLADGQQAAVGYVFNLISGADGSLWGAAARDGVFQIKAGRLKSWPVANGSTVGKVQWISEDEAGVVWAGSTEGIVRVKNGDLRLITPVDGLLDNLITALVLDDRGSFWADSNKGIFRVSRESLNDFADGKTERVECKGFDSLNDVKSMERNQQKPSGCKTRDGRVWFPTAQGVVMIDPSHLTENPVPPQIHVDAVRANGRELRQSGVVVVPPGKGELEFHFTALSFVASQKIQFRYRLEGYDKDWVGPTSRRMAFYTNLPPGKYRFSVTAANGDGVWNETGSAVQLELRPHVYQTVWFAVLGGGAFLVVLAGVYGWRVRLLRQKQQELREARDRLELQVQHRTSELANVNRSLQSEIEGHQLTVEQLHQKTHSLETEIGEGKRLQSEVEATQLKLRAASRQAGMAEVATGVLHNVGNVLNSVNVSATLVSDHVRHSKSGSVAKLAALLDEHRADLPAFLTQDPRGRMIPSYLSTLTEALAQEQATLLGELDHLRKNVDHIKDVVAMQQGYANTSGFIETVSLNDLVEEALRMNTASLAGHDVEFVRDFRFGSTITTDRHKVAQILINLVRNAKQACDETGRADSQIVVRTRAGERGVEIAIVDNGAGVPAENITRIFNHGFTTKQDGHGFGLHNSALAARELGGSLRVQSDGPGTGATFTLELPAELQREAQPAHGSNPTPIYL